MSRRQIGMDPAELRSFLLEERTLICATKGPRGWPHLMPLWFVLRGEDVWCWTYAKSQKTRNLERDSRATLQVEAGEHYDELRGVMIEAETTIHRDPQTVLEVGMKLARRYEGGLLETVRSQAAKRVAFEFKAKHVVSWDHRKLGSGR